MSGQFEQDRLGAGRHHLQNGGRALALGYLDEGRAHFLAALHQFRGPELRLGEAHALRGLAQVALAAGDLASAEQRAGQAVIAYSELAASLSADEFPERVLPWQIEAAHGEAAAWALQGEILARQGRTADASAVLERARARLVEGGGGGAAAAALWANLGRLAARDGRLDEARVALERAGDVYAELDDGEGRILTCLSMADLDRMQGQSEAAWDRLSEGLRLARSLDLEGLEARVRCALGAVALHDDRAIEASTAYELALPLARRAGDAECEAIALVGAGLALARVGEPAALRRLVDGARLWASLGHTPGTASALLHLADVARRADLPILMLLSSEGARRGFVLCDPERGQGQALRRIVKALTSLRLGRGALIAAVARERVAGPSQPQAARVAAWFLERSSPELREEVGAADRDVLLAWTAEAVAKALGPTMLARDGSEDDLADPVRVVEIAAELVTDAERAGLRPLRGSLRAATTDVPIEDERTEDDIPQAEPPPAPVPVRRAAAPVSDLYGDIFGGKR